MRIPQKMQFSWFVGIGDNSDLQILLLYLKNVTAHELEAQWGHGREIHCSEGWLWPPPSAQLLSQSHQEPAQASTKTKIIIPPSNIPGTFPKVKTFLPQVCYFNALFIYWSVKIIKFFGQTMIISCDNLSEWHSHTFFFFLLIIWVLDQLSEKILFQLRNAGVREVKLQQFVTGGVICTRKLCFYLTTGFLQPQI